MKKSILLGAAALMLIATSCSNDETVEMPKGNAIGFKTMVDKNQGRAAVSATAQFTNFKVWGYENKLPLFAAQEVKGSLGEPWAYSPLKYWAAGAEYSFTAIGSDQNPCSAVYTTEVPATYNQAGFGSFTFDNSAAKGNEDVVYAFDSRKTNNPLTADDTKEVGLAFAHSLARVKFTFVNGFSSAYEMQITGLQIDNAVSTGTFTVLDGKWSNTTEVENNTFALLYDESDAVIAGNSAVCDYQYIIPAATTQNLAISFTVTITDVDTKVARDFTLTGKLLNLPEGSNNIYLKGHSYNFTATIDPSVVDPGQEELKPIEFTATVGEWNADEEGTVTVQ